MVNLKCKFELFRDTEWKFSRPNCGPFALENKVQLLPIVSSESFCAHKILSLKFMQIFADNHGAFCLVFAFSFTSCYNPNVSQQFGMSQ